MKNRTSKGQSSSGQIRRLKTDELAVEKSHLTDIQRHTLSLRIIRHITESGVEEGVHGRMSNVPFQGLHDVAFHLDVHVLLVQTFTHSDELIDMRDLLATLVVLRCDEHCHTPDKLKVLLVYNSSGAISVEDIDGQEKGFRVEIESSMGFDEEVKQQRTHAPLQLGLDVDGSDVGKSFGLEGQLDKLKRAVKISYLEFILVF